jgi:hypothetical protein
VRAFMEWPNALLIPNLDEPEPKREIRNREDAKNAKKI